MKAVIIDPSFLGDAVFDAAMARDLKEQGVASSVDLVLRPPYQALAPAMSWVDHVWVYDKRGVDAGVRGLARMARTLRRRAYDIAYVVHPSVRSWMLAKAAGIQRAVRATRTDLGFMGRRGVLYGNDAETPLAGSLRSPAPPADAPCVGLVLGSQWPTKRWPIERAAHWVTFARARGVSIRLLGSTDERQLATELVAKVGPQGIDDRCGQPLSELVDSIASLAALVAGDTGPLHIARALGVPVIGLFGPTSELLHHFGPRDTPLTVDINCRPCSTHGHRSCPLGHHRCMQELSAERVDAAVHSVLFPTP